MEDSRLMTNICENVQFAQLNLLTDDTVMMHLICNKINNIQIII